MTKLKLDMYYVMTNSYTEFQVNISKDGIEKSGKLILAKGNNSRKSRSRVTKLKLDLYYVMTNSYTKFQVNISKDNREKSWKLKCDGLAKGNNSRENWSSVTKLKLDLYYVMTNSYTKFQVNISKDDKEKSGKLKCDGLAKGNNSRENWSSVTKLKLDLYYVMTNSYTKFQVNISKDDREKSGKLKCDGRTDWQTDGQRVN